MNKGAYITYRIIGTMLTLLAYFAFFMDIAYLFQAGFDPAMLPPLFIAGCMVIYTVLSRLFAHVVLKEQRPLRRSLKDWIIANAGVVILGLGLGIYQSLSAIFKKAFIEEFIGMWNHAARDAGSKAPMVTHAAVASLFVFIAFILLLGVIHAVWTLFLVKRNKEFFQ